MSITTMNIPVKKTENSRLGEVDMSNLQFGKVCSDHMLVATYQKGSWGAPEIMPYGNLSLSPATSFMHYGQAIFEGVKAYKNTDGEPVIFRPYDNWRRMNMSAERLAMPAVPEEIFIEGMKQLIKLDENWIPDGPDTSLYIRPFMLAADEFIGVKPSEKFLFIIITSPAGPYYDKPVNIYVQDKYVRAFPGGIGYTKAAGNYGMSMYPTQEVKKMGYDQLLWTDGFEHKYVQEIGTMNVFFIIGNKAITPDLSLGTILAGVTRDSVITLLREKGLEVEERRLSIDEIVAAHQAGELKEAFGTGTAASISPIASLTYQEEKIVLPEDRKWGSWLKKELNGIRTGQVPDNHNWLVSAE